MKVLLNSPITRSSQLILYPRLLSRSAPRRLYSYTIAARSAFPRTNKAPVPFSSQSPRHRFVASSLKSRQFIRNCLAHKMCRGSGVSGAVDITQGREVLPGNVKPTNYAVELEPNLETFKYDGTVVIEYVSFCGRRPNQFKLMLFTG